MSSPPSAPLPEAQPPELQAAAGATTPEDKFAVPPTPGETIISNLTGSTYTIGDLIGEGSFGTVYG